MYKQKGFILGFLFCDGKIAGIHRLSSESLYTSGLLIICQIYTIYIKKRIIK